MIGFRCIFISWHAVEKLLPKWFVGRFALLSLSVRDCLLAKPHFKHGAFCTKATSKGWERNVQTGRIWVRCQQLWTRWEPRRLPVGIQAWSDPDSLVAGLRTHKPKPLCYCRELLWPWQQRSGVQHPAKGGRKRLLAREQRSLRQEGWIPWLFCWNQRACRAAQGEADESVTVPTLTGLGCSSAACSVSAWLETCGLLLEKKGCNHQEFQMDHLLQSFEFWHRKGCSDFLNPENLYKVNTDAS